MNQQVAVRYSPEAKAEILNYVLTEVATGRSVRRIFMEDEGLPEERTFWTWHFNDPEYQQELGRARALGQEARLDEIPDIIDEATDDAEIVYRDGVAVGARINGKAIARARLQAEYRVKMAQMLSPKKYGQKLDLTSGGEQLKPTQLTDNRVQALVGLAVERKLKALKSEGEDDA